MKIAVFGCGAMGSIYAALLASAQNDVICIDRNADHVAAINERGLRVSGASGDRIVWPGAFVRAPDDPVDLLVVAVKAAHVSAVADATGLIGPQTQVLTIQNGLGSSDVVAGIVGSERLLVGIAQGFGAALIEPGHSHHNDMKAIRIGRHDPAGTASPEVVVDIFRMAGFDVSPADDIAAMQWEKLICNVAYSGPCALTGMTVGEVMDDPYIGPLSRAAAQEAYRIAGLRGIRLNVDDPVELVRAFAARMPDAKPSVLLDIEAGRPSEIDVINGAVEREAARVGAEAPVNRTITALVQSMEARAANQQTGEST